MEQNIYQDFYFKEALSDMFEVKQTSKLIQVLNENGIRFFKTGHGDPFVARSEFERKATKRKSSPKTSETEWESNALKT